MKAVDYLDPNLVYREIQSNPSWWSTEDEKRKYVRIGDELSVTSGCRGIVASLDEWKIILKLITPETLETLKGILEDFADMDRMGIRYCYGEKQAI